MRVEFEGQVSTAKALEAKLAKPPTVEEITVLLMESLELLHEADTVNTDDFDERLEAFFAKARMVLR